MAVAVNWSDSPTPIVVSGGVTSRATGSSGGGSSSSSVTVAETGNSIKPSLAALDDTHSTASSSSPALRSDASIVTVASSDSPGSVVPDSGSTESHGTPVGSVHVGDSASPVTFITMCMSGKSISAGSVGSYMSQSSDAIYEGAVSPSGFDPM